MSGPAKTTRRYGYSKGPCPGCHTGDDHPTGGVCGTCASILKHADEDRAKRAKLAEAGKTYLVPESHGSLPYVRYGRRWSGQSDGDPTSGTGGSVQWAYHDVLMSIATKMTEIPRYSDTADKAELLVKSDNPDHRCSPVVVTMRPDQAAALRTLWTAIMANNKAAYQEGFDAGQSLLNGLANGSLTIAQVNERTVKAGS